MCGSFGAAGAGGGRWPGRESPQRRPLIRWSLFARGGIDHSLDLGNAVGREAAALRVFADGGFIWSDVDAIDFVLRDEAFEPLHARGHVADDTAGFAGHV